MVLVSASVGTVSRVLRAVASIIITIVGVFRPQGIVVVASIGTIIWVVWWWVVMVVITVIVIVVSTMSTTMPMVGLVWCCAVAVAVPAALIGVAGVRGALGAACEGLAQVGNEGDGRETVPTGNWGSKAGDHSTGSRRQLALSAKVSIRCVRVWAETSCGGD